ncbi:NPC intracellular cholesterol transporter 2-like [Ostrea edulis]|uniref:NPC intracellular cholesterol transporter 2-like n=1 Tax=Ostrea edulis TaxID=37623 RepID=UPI0020945087|nr:NPC intracellular cholesterol transporter 2-like [Ostrea edulis]
MIKFITLVALAFSAVNAVSVKFTTCRTPQAVHGHLSTVDVNPCPAEPCPLPHGKNITLTATFTPKINSTTFKSVVHGIILSLPVPYTVPMGSMSGPIEAGKEIVYTNSLYVSPLYPQLRLTVEWEVRDDHNRNLFCFYLPVHITSH